MTINEFSCNGPEDTSSFLIIPCWVVLKWGWKYNSSDFPWRISRSSPRSRRSRVKVDILRRCSPHRFWLFHLRREIWIFHFFAALRLPLHGAFWRWVHMRPSPPFLHNVCDHNVSFPDSHRVQNITEKCTWQDVCSKLMQSRLIFRRNKVIFEHCAKRYHWSVKMVSRIAFHVVSAQQTRDLQCFADSNSIPWNPPTIRYPDRTAIAPQMSLLSLCALLFRQSHFSDLCGVDVQWFQERSSNALPNSRELSV